MPRASGFLFFLNWSKREEKEKENGRIIMKIVYILVEFAFFLWWKWKYIFIHKFYNGMWFHEREICCVHVLWLLFSIFSFLIRFSAKKKKKFKWKKIDGYFRVLDLLQHGILSHKHTHFPYPHHASPTPPYPPHTTIDSRSMK